MAYRSRSMTDTWKRRGRVFVGIAGFTAAMSLRYELSSVALRALVAGLGMAFLFLALQYAQRPR